MDSITTVRYSILINMTPSSSNVPTRGIRQGITCHSMSSSSMLLHKAESKGCLCGVVIAWGALRISQLIFTDNRLLFCQARLGDFNAIFEILHSYEMASGKVNIDKSDIICSANTRLPDRDAIMNCLCIALMFGDSEYLGVPIMVGRPSSTIYLCREHLQNTLDILA